jgi:aspartate dehydrogenase
MGAELANAIARGDAGKASLVALFDTDASAASALAESLPVRVPFYTDLDAFLATPGLDLVTECAAPAAVRACARQVLLAGKDLLIMSSGALTDSALCEELYDLSTESNLRLMVPSGALGGIDAIRAVRGHLDEVVLTTTKPPEGLRGAPGFKDWEDHTFDGAQVIYEGPALEAVGLFPANVNVAATLSLVGLGAVKTKVTVVADPASPGNVHEITAKGDFGLMRFRLENVPHSRNPRTSYLAVLSALETLRSACTPGPRIGT